MKTKFETRSRKTLLQESNIQAMVRVDAEWGKTSILAFGLAEHEKEMRAVEESTHEIIMRSNQHAYKKDASDDESDDEAPVC